MPGTKKRTAAAQRSSVRPARPSARAAQHARTAVENLPKWQPPAVRREQVLGALAGNVEVTGDIILQSADCAEDFDILEAQKVDPGTGMVIDQDGALKQSEKAYDKRVAGVISGAGGYKPGIILDKQQSVTSRMPVALVGKAYCKVDAQY